MMFSLRDFSPFLDRRANKVRPQSAEQSELATGIGQSGRSDNALAGQLQSKATEFDALEPEADQGKGLQCISELVESIRKMVDSGKATLSQLNSMKGDLLDLVDDNELAIEQKGLEEWSNEQVREVNRLIDRAILTSKNVNQLVLGSDVEDDDEDDRGENYAQILPPGLSGSQDSEEDREEDKQDPHWLKSGYIIEAIGLLRQTLFATNMYEPYTDTYLGRDVKGHDPRILPDQRTPRKWLSAEHSELASSLRSADVHAFRECVRQYMKRWYWESFATVDHFMTALFRAYRRHVYNDYRRRESMAIECRVEGQTATALVDTGSEGSSISEWLAIKVGLGNQINKSQQMVLAGVQGTHKQAPRSLGHVYGLKIEINGVPLKIDAMVVKERPVRDLLIGMDFLGTQKCRVFCQAIHANAIAKQILAQRDPPRGVSLTSKVIIGHLEPKKNTAFPRPVISCRLNGKSATAVVDTGAECSLISTKMWNEYKTLKDNDIENKESESESHSEGEDSVIYPPMVTNTFAYEDNESKDDNKMSIPYMDDKLDDCLIEDAIVQEFRGAHLGAGGRFVDEGLVARVKIEIGSEISKTLMSFIALTLVEKRDQKYITIGMDFLSRHGCVIDCRTREVTFGYLNPEGIAGLGPASASFGS